MRVDESAARGLENDSEQIADANAAEGEAADTRGPAALLLENYWVGDEGEVEGSVDDCYVDVPKETEIKRLVPCPFPLNKSWVLDLFLWFLWGEKRERERSIEWCKGERRLTKLAL